MLKWIVKYENTDKTVKQGFIKNSGYNDKDNNWKLRREYTNDITKAEDFLNFAYASEELIYNYDRRDTNGCYIMYEYDSKTKKLFKRMEACNKEVNN